MKKSINVKDKKLAYIDEGKGDAIVFIHGWRGNKDSFKSLPSMLKINNVEWFFPEAPYLIDDNVNIRSWSKQNQDGTHDVSKSKLYLDKFLHDILKSYKPENIFL